jgi:hypothetical protein
MADIAFSPTAHRQALCFYYGLRIVYVRTKEVVASVLAVGSLWNIERKK